MKKLLLIALLLFPAAALAQQNYSGIYLGTNAQHTAYFSIHHNTEDRGIIVTALDDDNNGWTALEGTLTGGYSALTSILESGEVKLEIDFKTPTKAEISVKECGRSVRISCYRMFREDSKIILLKIQ